MNTKQPGDNQAPLMDIDELAAYLGVTESFVRRLIHERRIPFHKIGKFIRFRHADIETWIQAQRVDQLGSH